jgi:hypothetical protein
MDKLATPRLKMPAPYVKVELHRWWNQPYPDWLPSEALNAYVPRPDLCYQKDHELGDHYSLLTDAQLDSVKHQLAEGKTVWPRLLLHVCDRHIDHVLLWLDSELEDSLDLENLALAAYNHLIHFENELVAQALMGWLMEQGCEPSELADAVFEVHWKENHEPTYRAVFMAECEKARNAHIRIRLERTLKQGDKPHKTQKI